MSGTLTFPDVESLADLGTYAARAKGLDPDGAVRLQAVGEVLAAWTCAVPGQGLMRSGTVLALRTMPLAGEHALDVTVPLGGLTDRFARRLATGDAGTVLPVPPTTVSPQWAGVMPPRAGWEQVGEVPTEVLLAAADAGIAEIAQGAPEGSGAAAVGMLRAQVWAREIGGAEGVGGAVAGGAVTGGAVTRGASAGAGFAAKILGFARPGDGLVARVFRSGAWTRVSLPAGHVLTR